MVDEYFEDIVKFFTIGMAPQGYTITQKKKLVFKETDYQLIGGRLYKLGPDEIL